MNQFAERYKSLSNAQLLRIANSPTDYQLPAVEAAKTELSTRQLTTEDIAAAVQENEVEDNKKRAELERKLASEKVLKATVSSLGDIIKRPPSKNKVKIIISIAFSLMFLVDAFGSFSWVKFMFTDDRALWDKSMVASIILLLSIPVGLVLFWLRKKSGWTIIVGYIIYSICYSIIILIEWIFILYPENLFAKTIFSPVSVIVPFFLKMLFYGGMLWGICRRDIRSDFYVDKSMMVTIICFTVVLTILLSRLGLLV